MVKLKIDQLHWSPSGKQSLLEAISLHVNQGQFVGLIGANGCGKTSLLRCAFRHHQPHSGAIYLNGQDIWQQPARWSAQRIAVVLQEFPSDFGLTVYDVVAMGRTPHKSWLENDNNQDKQFISQISQQLNLHDLINQPFLTLSGGEKQRVLLARALVQQPEIMILDEPTNHLDPGYQIELLRFLRHSGLSILASFHDLNLATAFCDQLYVLHDGHIIAHGPPEQVITPALIKTLFNTNVLIDRHPVGHYPRLTWVIE